MSKDQNFLDRLKAKFNPANAMMGMVETLLPKLAETLQAMEKPKSEGGILEEGQDKVAFVVVQVNGELMISICPLAKTENKMEMCKPVNTQPLEQMLKQNQQKNEEGEGTNQ